MAFTLKSSAGSVSEPAMVNLLCTGAVAVGDMLINQRGETVRSLARSSSPSAQEIIFIAMDANTSGTAYINVIPVNNIQMWEADTTANTSVNYIGYTVGPSTYAYLNGATNASGTTAIFQILGNVGSTSNKKVVGRFMLSPIGE